MSHGGTGDTVPAVTFPQIATFHQNSSILRQIFDPYRLNRMENSEFKTPEKDELTLLELFRSVQGTIWSELDSKSNIGALRRNHISASR